MECPKCNKEVSPEWNMCPHCGYKPVKCSNPKCNSGWLPQEALFCPVCGRKTNADEEARRRKAEEEARRRAEEEKRKAELEQQKRKEEAQKNTSQKTISSSTTSSASHYSSYTPSKSSSSSSSFGKRIGYFLGAVAAGIGAGLCMDGGGFAMIVPGIFPLGVGSIYLLVGVFTKD